MPWRYSAEPHDLNPEGLKVIGEITVYRITSSDPPPESTFWTDFARGFRQPRGSYQRHWPLLMHSFSTFVDPARAVEVAGQAERRGRPIGSHLAALTINTEVHPVVSVCLSPGQDRANPSHFDVFGPPSLLRLLVAEVKPLREFDR